MFAKVFRQKAYRKNNSLIQSVLSEYPNISLSYYPDWNFNSEVGFKNLTRQFNTINLQSFGLAEDSPEVPVAGFLLDYLEKTTNSKIPHVSGISVYHDNQYLIIDDSSLYCGNCRISSVPERFCRAIHAHVPAECIYQR